MGRGGRPVVLAVPLEPDLVIHFGAHFSRYGLPVPDRGQVMSISLGQPVHREHVDRARHGQAGHGQDPNRLEREQDRNRRQAAHTRSEENVQMPQLSPGSMVSVGERHAPCLRCRLPEQQFEERLLGVQPILRLVPDDGLGTIHDLVRDLEPAMRRKVVKDEGPGLGVG
jgi:hypothetical protein